VSPDITAADGHVYNKSSSANAKVAPTSGSTQSAEEQASNSATKLGGAAGFNEEDLDFVTIVDMHWGVTGVLLTAPVGQDRYGIPIDTYITCMKKPKVKRALAERGISLKSLEQASPNSTGELIPQQPDRSWRDASLTPAQLIVANTMLDLIDTRNDRKKLQDLGVSSSTYNNWLRQPEFQKYLRDRAESLIGASQHEAALAMIDKVKSGDPKMIEFFYEYTGKFSRRADTSVLSGAASGSLNSENVTSLIQSIIEIIVEEVDDPAVGARISDRMRGLISARNTANELVSSLNPSPINPLQPTPVIIPEVAQSREITPDIKALMDSGIGSDT